jgi:hypothetical protein
MKRLFFAVIVLPLAAVPLSAEDAKPKPVAVPFELLPSKHMVVKIKVNGKGPYRVIFDTGSPVTLLSAKAAKEAGVVPKDAMQPAFALFGAMGQFPIKKLDLGGAQAEKVPAMVMDHPALGVLAKEAGPLEGIVGFPFFARYRMTVDYQAKKLTFVANGYKPDDLIQTLTAALTAKEKPAPRVLSAAGLWGFEVAKGEKDEEPGVTVEKVYTGGAAEAGGLKAGDRLLTLDGRWTDSVLDCYHAAVAVKPGTAAAVTVRRSSREVRLTITPRTGL